LELITQAELPMNLCFKTVPRDLYTSLILAGLAAEGSTVISNVEHIDRGYEEIDKRLNSIGADIIRTK